MQRPILNPGISPDDPTHSAPRRTLQWLVARAWLRNAGRLLWRMLTYNPLRVGPVRVRIEDGTFYQRLFRGICYRLTFVPIVAALSAAALVWTATHPPVHAPLMDPSSMGIYYDPVSLMSEDGTRFEGWLVPVVDARQVLEHKDNVLRMRRPAVVLLHDHGHSRQQMLPLVQPLHEAGFVVLAVSLRGRGGGDRNGVTFGLREAADVKAAVELLRRRPFVDPSKVAVVGVGSGANAALLAARSDPAIAAVAAISPHENVRDLLDSTLGPKQAWLSFLNPLCKWTFEMAYSVDVEELDLKRFAKLIETRPVLIEHAGPLTELGSAHTQAISAFLDTHLPTVGATAEAR